MPRGSHVSVHLTARELTNFLQGSFRKLYVTTMYQGIEKIARTIRTRTHKLGCEKVIAGQKILALFCC